MPLEANQSESWLPSYDYYFLPQMLVYRTGQASQSTQTSHKTSNGSSFGHEYILIGITVMGQNWMPLLQICCMHQTNSTYWSVWSFCSASSSSATSAIWSASSSSISTSSETPSVCSLASKGPSDWNEHHLRYSGVQTGSEELLIGPYHPCFVP